MISSRTFRICILFSLIVSSAFGLYSSSPTEAGPRQGGTVVTPIATGLHNPRGLNFGPDSQLYVAEAGANGAPSTVCGVMGDGMTKCNARTGSITRVNPAGGSQEVVFDGVPSLISPSGVAAGATGVHDIAFQGETAFATIGFGANPSLRYGYFGPSGGFYSRLGKVGAGGRFTFQEDLGNYESTQNPDGLAADTNPYGILALPESVIYTDAGGNTLNAVGRNGITTLAVFPNRAVPLPSPAPPGSTVVVQAVPTSVALGPDRNLYVGQLTGFPFQVGVANVYRVPVGGGTPVVAYTGFTNIIDLAFGPDGSLYVLEIAQNAIPNFGGGGKLVRIFPGGSRITLLAGPPLIAPGGIAVGNDGTLYVTVNSTSPTAGAVWRVEADSPALSERDRKK